MGPSAVRRHDIATIMMPSMTAWAMTSVRKLRCQFGATAARVKNARMIYWMPGFLDYGRLEACPTTKL